MEDRFILSGGHLSVGFLLFALSLENKKALNASIPMEELIGAR
jgi:hypothetical protein